MLEWVRYIAQCSAKLWQVGYNVVKLDKKLDLEIQERREGDAQLFAKIEEFQQEAIQGRKEIHAKLDGLMQALIASPKGAQDDELLP